MSIFYKDSDGKTRVKTSPNDNTDNYSDCDPSNFRSSSSEKESSKMSTTTKVAISAGIALVTGVWLG